MQPFTFIALLFDLKGGKNVPVDKIHLMRPGYDLLYSFQVFHAAIVGTWIVGFQWVGKDIGLELIDKGIGEKLQWHISSLELRLTEGDDIIPCSPIVFEAARSKFNLILFDCLINKLHNGIMMVSLTQLDIFYTSGGDIFTLQFQIQVNIKQLCFYGIQVK